MIKQKKDNENNKFADINKPKEGLITFRSSKESFVIGIKGTYFYIDVTPDLLEEHSKTSEIHKFLKFNINTYNNLSNDQKINQTLNPVPKLVNTLFTKEEKKKLIKMFIEIKKAMFNYYLQKDDLSDNEVVIRIEQLVNQIGEIVYQYFTELNIKEKFQNYILEGNIAIPDLTNVGKRIQDQKKTTLFYDDYVSLLTLSPLCKLLCGVFGEVIAIVSDSPIDNTLKEIYAYLTIKKYVDEHFFDAATKIINMIKNQIQRQIETDDINTLCKGFDDTKIWTRIFSSTIVKKLVNIVLYDDGVTTNDIATYIFSCIGKTLSSEFNTLKKNERFMERYASGDVFSDDDNEAEIIDDESIIFNVTIDIPILIRHTVKDIYKDFLEKSSFNKEIVDSVIDYYIACPLQITPFNEFMVSIYSSKYLQYGHGIKVFRAKEMSTMVAILQLTLLEIPEFHDLIHLLSVSTDYEFKGIITEVDNFIKLSKGVGDSYRIVKSQMNHISKVIKWDNFIERTIIPFICNYKLYYNTAPTILEILGANIENKSPLQYNKTIIMKLYDFIVQYLFHKTV